MAPSTAPLPDSAAAAKPLNAQHTVVVYTDGACRGNPGLSGAGWVIDVQDGPQPCSYTGTLFLGTRTNNEAEYLAAALGLQAAKDLGAQKVILRADSELLVRQVLGIYRVKNARLVPLHQAVVALSRSFSKFEAQHVRREFNSRADHQANLAIDNRPRS
jgi:ribonuclease HI